MEMPGHFALRPSAPQRFARDRSVDTKSNCAISRRAFVAGSGGLALAALTQSWPAGAASRYTLVAAAGSAPMVGSTYPETAFWSYNGTVPGPELRSEENTSELQSLMPISSAVYCVKKKKHKSNQS